MIVAWTTPPPLEGQRHRRRQGRQATATASPPPYLLAPSRALVQTYSWEEEAPPLDSMSNHRQASISNFMCSFTFIVPAMLGGRKNAKVSFYFLFLQESWTYRQHQQVRETSEKTDKTYSFLSKLDAGFEHFRARNWIALKDVSQQPCKS